MGIPYCPATVVVGSSTPDGNSLKGEIQQKGHWSNVVTPLKFFDFLQAIKIIKQLQQIKLMQSTHSEKN